MSGALLRKGHGLSGGMCEDLGVKGLSVGKIGAPRSTSWSSNHMSAHR